jgi:uncharacterized protein with PIN domain
VKVYLDENLSAEIARLLRGMGVDAVSARETERYEITDRAQLVMATAEDRAIVTRDVVDFLALSRQAIASNTEHAGIIIVPASFRGDEFQLIADRIHDVTRRYPGGLRGSVLFLRREASPD